MAGGCLLDTFPIEKSFAAGFGFDLCTLFATALMRLGDFERIRFRCLFFFGVQVVLADWVASRGRICQIMPLPELKSNWGHTRSTVANHCASGEESRTGAMGARHSAFFFHQLFCVLHQRVSYFLSLFHVLQGL